jgi:hypothetical protein
MVCIESLKIIMAHYLMPLTIHDTQKVRVGLMLERPEPWDVDAPSAAHIQINTRGAPPNADTSWRLVSRLTGRPFWAARKHGDLYGNLTTELHDRLGPTVFPRGQWNDCWLVVKQGRVPRAATQSA